MKIFLISLAGALFSLNVLAGNNIVATHPWVRALPPGIVTTAAYMTLENQGDAGLAINSVSSPQFGMAHLHKTTMEEGQMKMSPIEHAEISPGSEFILQPGGNHIMLMNRIIDLNEGDRVEIRLEFSDGSSLIVHAPVKKQ